ncbi:MAG: TorF family putative porin [Pseudomonadota bacterium]
MKNMIKSCAAGTLIFASSMANAGWLEETEISANVAMATNYLFYGASQTAANNDGTFDSGGPAVSGGFDIALPFEILGGQFYAGTWASSVQWGGNNPATLELDYYGGIAGDSIGSTGISWDLGTWWYTYPNQSSDAGANGFDYTEWYANLGYSFDAPLSPSISVGVYYSDDYFGTDLESLYIPFGIDISLPMDFGAYFGGGYFDLEDTGEYVHYSIGLTKTFLGVDMDASWNGQDNDCGAVQGTNCGGLMFSASKAF